MASGVATIEERIARRGEALTPAERQLASMLTDDPTVWAFSTVADVAERVGTSGPTVIRFAVALGFAGFTELQRHVRDDVTAKLSRPSERMQLPPDSSGPASTLEAIASTFERLDEDRLDSIARTLAGATGVWIVASESSSPVAHLLATNLTLIRPGIVRLGGSGPSTASAIVDASDRDAAIAIDFPRYEHTVVDAATALADRGTTITALTDGPLSPLAGVATTWCSVVVPSVGPFDSAVPTIAVAEVIIARIAAYLGSVATRRLHAVEQHWERDRMFLPRHDGRNPGTRHRPTDDPF